MCLFIHYNICLIFIKILNFFHSFKYVLYENDLVLREKIFQNYNNTFNGGKQKLFMAFQLENKLNHWLLL